MPSRAGNHAGKPNGGTHRGHLHQNGHAGIAGRFVLGLYRRQMKAISYLGRIERLLSVAATTRNYNTIQKIVEILNDA